VLLLTKEGDKVVVDDELNWQGRSGFGSTTDKTFSDRVTVHNKT
jgi:hypothetical protein